VTDTTPGTALAVRRPTPLSPDARLFAEAMGRLADAHHVGARAYTQMLDGAARGGPGAAERAVRRAATEIVTLAHTLADLQGIAGIRQHLTDGLGDLGQLASLDVEAFLTALFESPAQAPTVPPRPGGAGPAEARAARVAGLDEGGGR